MGAVVAVGCMGAGADFAADPAVDAVVVVVVVVVGFVAAAAAVGVDGFVADADAGVVAVVVGAVWKGVS